MEILEIKNTDTINKNNEKNISSGYILQIEKLYKELEIKESENIRLRNKLDKYQKSDEMMKLFLRNIGINNTYDLIVLKDLIDL